jgi:hypothetical protein
MRGEAGAFHPLRRRVAMVPAVIAPALHSISAADAWSVGDHIDLSAAMLRARRPLAPIKDRYIGTITLGELGGLGLDLVTAAVTLDDQA